ncbi:hypothetical protein ACFW16_32615 [Inquilinus sp. NPDC058860]|uniref:hypothetical protein n=1 Tax=Inquilinus sp. NPDC058860 TaxID=3346652 RepID=UPI0036951488
MLASLSRQLAKLGERSTSAASISMSTLETLANAAIADRAAILREDRSAPGTFRLQHAIGFGDAPVPVDLLLGRAPAFYYTASSAGRFENTAAALSTFLGVPYVLWSYDKPSGFALLLGNIQEGNTARPYQESDRDLIDTALDIYLDALLHKAAPAADDAASNPQGGSDVPGPLVEGELLEVEIREQLREGGRITRAVVVERINDGGVEYTPYLSTSWRAGYSVLRTHRKSDKTYKDYTRLRQYLRGECEYSGPITNYVVGAEELHQLPGIKPEDLFGPGTIL